MTIKNNYPLSEILWYKVGGTAKYYIEAENKEDVLEALDFIKENKPQRIFICGLGSNLIFSDNFFDGVVLRIADSPYSSSDPELAEGESRRDGSRLCSNNIQVNGDGVVVCFGGVVLDDLILYAFENNLVGLEWAGGLPGTVGAGVRGNVGAFGGEIKDSFISAEVLEYDNTSFKVYEIKKEAFHFSYRNSIVKEKKKLIVLSAKFQLRKAEVEELEKAREVYKKNIDYRKVNHPIEYPTCGSVFKNIHNKEEVEKIVSIWPETKELVDRKWHGKFSMGYIIKRLGLIGFRVGNMEVSNKHSNFIINLGGAKASDAKAVIAKIQEEVLRTFGFEPEVEVEIVR